MRGIAHGEHIERELDLLITRRDAQRRLTEGELWRESQTRHEAKRREVNRLAWCAHFERMRAIHRLLADEYDSKLKALGEGAVVSAPMRRNKAGRRALHGHRWAVANPLLPARPRACRGGATPQGRARADPTPNSRISSGSLELSRTTYLAARSSEVPRR